MKENATASLEFDFESKNTVSIQVTKNSSSGNTREFINIPNIPSNCDASFRLGAADCEHSAHHCATNQTPGTVLARPEKLSGCQLSYQPETHGIKKL